MDTLASAKHLTVARAQVMTTVPTECAVVTNAAAQRAGAMDARRATLTATAKPVQAGSTVLAGSAKVAQPRARRASTGWVAAPAHPISSAVCAPTSTA